MDGQPHSFAREVAERVEAFRRALHRDLPDVVDQVIVFGSQARGDAHEGSDIDVAVLVRNGLHATREVRDAISRAAYEQLSDKFEFNALTLPHDFLHPVEGRYQSELARRIDREGVGVMTRSNAENGPEDEQAWLKVGLQMHEVALLDANQTPGTVVHAAYYAMHHAARAVLLRRDGTGAATKHTAVIGRFGFIAKNEVQDRSELMAAGRNLKEVYESRLDGDYSVAVTLTPEDASDCLAKTRNFIALCQAHFGFPDLPP